MNIEALTGKTILSASYMKLEKYDDAGFLKFEFSDGTSCVFVAGYTDFTSKSIGEYPTHIEFYFYPSIVNVPLQCTGLSFDINDLIPI